MPGRNENNVADELIFLYAISCLPISRELFLPAVNNFVLHCIHLPFKLVQMNSGSREMIVD